MSKVDQEIKEQSLKLLSEFLNTHEEVYHIVAKLFATEAVLSKNETRYMFLVSLIGSDNVVDIESAEKSLKELNYIKDSLDYLHLSNDIKKEVIKYVNKGIKIVKRDLKEFKKNENN